MDALGTARLAEEIPAERAITATVSRDEIAGALQDPAGSPELYLDVIRGEEQGTIGISWSHDDLEQLLTRTSGDDILLAFDRDELDWMFDDVEAHGMREKALVFAVAAAGALGSGATIANAAPTLADPGSVPAAAVQTAVSNVHSPGLQLGAEGSAPVAAVASNVTVASTDAGISANAHTPGLQLGAEGSAATSEIGSAATVASSDAGIPGNVRTPGLQIGDDPATAATPSVQVSASTSSDEVFGVPSKDVTDALIAGGVLLAIAGATFAGGRRMGTTRPA